MHTFKVTRSERVYNEGQCETIVPMTGRVILKIPLRRACSVSSVDIRVADMYGVCKGTMLVTVTTDRGANHTVSLDVERDIIPVKSIHVALDPALPSDGVVTVDIVSAYSGQGCLCLLHGVRGWAGTIEGTTEGIYSLHSLLTIAVVMPVYGAPESVFKEALKSLAEQSYPHWHLFAHIEEGSDLDLALTSFKSLYPKAVTVVRGKPGQGISRSMNAATEAAVRNETPIVAFMDCDDTLHLDALLNVAKVFSDRPETAMVYTDEDKLDEAGRHIEAHYKPDFSKEMLISQNYPCHLTAVASWVLNDMVKYEYANAYFRPKYDGAQDHDFWLRCMRFVEESAVVHIPKVLYHWRQTKGSTAKNPLSKLWAFDAGLEAVRDYVFMLWGEHEGVYRGPYLGTYRVRKKVLGWPDVYIIIPTSNNVSVLEANLNSLATMQYPGVKYVHVVANKCSTEVLTQMEDMKNRGLFDHLQRYEDEFNWSAINNSAVDSIFYATKGCPETHKSAIVFMNDDVEALDPWWLDEMIRELWQEGVGIVGPKLLYPDMRIQHAGVVIGMGGVAGHAHKRLPDSNHGYFCRPHITQQMSAVTGACMAVKAEVFLGSGGFDEEMPKAFNDIDFCLKVREMGFKIVYTPWARLVHHESFSRGVDAGDDPVFQAAVKSMQDRWKCGTYRDPFFNPNLDLRSEEFVPR